MGPLNSFRTKLLLLLPLPPLLVLLLLLLPQQQKKSPTFLPNMEIESRVSLITEVESPIMFRGARQFVSQLTDFVFPLLSQDHTQKVLVMCKFKSLKNNHIDFPLMN